MQGGLDDGSRGLAAIAEQGGRTLVLGHNGIAFEGMPRNASLADPTSTIVSSSAEVFRELDSFLTG